MKVTVGEYDTEHQTYDEKSFASRQLHIHPDYDDINYINDLCLIGISSEIKFSRYVSKACLPDSTAVEPGTECYIAGWGTVDYDVPRYPEILKEMGLYF